MKIFIFALQYLTRIRLCNLDYDERSYGRSGMFFPLVGIVLGGLTAALYWLSGLLLPPPAAPAVALVGLVTLTGGLHLDGFMDTVDGLFSGRPREKKLEIMKDSRVGAFGALGVCCLLLLKFSLLAGLTAFRDFQVLIMLAVFSRWAMTYALARFPYVRQDGLGTPYTRHTGIFELAVASLTALLTAAAAGGAGGLAIFGATVVAAHIICSYFKNLLGGLTGDTYGALNEVLEVFVLLIYLPLHKFMPGLFIW